MTQHCTGKSKALVTIEFGDRRKEVITTKAPIDIEQGERQVAGEGEIKCWNFYSTDGAFTTLACCKNAEYRPIGGDVDPRWPGSTVRMGLFCDGQLLVGSHWYYGNGYQALAVVTDPSSVTKGYADNSGNCTACIGNACFISVGGRTFEGACPIKYEVACDDECPPGYCKCPIDTYPGYCCLDCKEVAAKINNLAARCKCG